MSGDFRKYPEIELALADMGVQPRLVICAPVLPSQDLAGVCNPMAECCAKRRVSLTADRSEFTREAFGGI